MNIGPTILKPQPWGDGYEEYGALQAMVDGRDDIPLPPRLKVEVDARTFDSLSQFTSVEAPSELAFDIAEMWSLTSWSNRLGARAADCEPVLFLNVGTVDLFLQLQLSSLHTRMHFDRWWFTGKLPLTFVCATSGSHIHSQIDACPGMPRLASRRMYGTRLYRKSAEIEVCAMVIDIAHRRRTELRRMGVDVSVRSMFFATFMSPADALWNDFSSMAFDVRTFIDSSNRSHFSLLHPPLGSKATRNWPIAPTEDNIYNYRHWHGEDESAMDSEFDPPCGTVGERWTRTALSPPPYLSKVIEEARQVSAMALQDGPAGWLSPLFDDAGESFQHKGDRLRGPKLRVLKAFGGFQFRSDSADAWLARGPMLIGALARKAASLRVGYPDRAVDNDKNYWPWCQGPDLRAEYVHQMASHLAAGAVIRALADKFACHQQLWRLHECFDVALRWLEDGVGELPDENFIKTILCDAGSAAREKDTTTRNWHLPIELQAHAERLNKQDVAASTVLDGASPDLVRSWGMGGGHDFQSFSFLYRLLARVPSFTMDDAQNYMGKLRNAVAAKSAKGEQALNEYLDFLCTSLTKLNELQMALKGEASWTRAWLGKFLTLLDAPRGPTSIRKEERSWNLSPTSDGLPLLRVALRMDPDACSDLDPLIWIQEELVLPTRETLLAILLTEKDKLPACSSWKDALWLSIVNETTEAMAAALKKEQSIREAEFAAWSS
ncbi:hypothetical protein [Rhizobacter sp. Root404]|uniref:hypothetical protein n=1 Tax=Rhizobacter sp. Root404 TaxID=1736528 RepID=UPI0012FA29A8|nr:hypothetical protein [Rhizobacter sp. Root404]